MNGNEKLTQQMTDDELIAEYLKGNIHYFDSLLKRYEAKLFNYIYRLIGQRQEAENIFQDVFSRVIDHMAAYQKNVKFGAWIFKIALNLCRDNLRKRKKMITISLNQQFGSTDSQDCSLENLIASDAPSSSNEVGSTTSAVTSKVHDFMPAIALEIVTEPVLPTYFVDTVYLMFVFLDI